MKKLERNEMKSLKGGLYEGGGGGEYCCMLYCYDANLEYLGKVSIGNTCGSNPPEVCRNFYPTTANVACACGQQNW